MNSLSFLAHPCPVHVLLFCCKTHCTPCAVVRAMADALQPAVQRPRADQGAINAAQAVAPQVSPPPAAEPVPRPDQLPNPPAEQLEVFHYFFVALYLFVFVFSPMLVRALVFLFFFYLAPTLFYWFSPFSLLASCITSFTFCLVVCSFTSCIHFGMPRFITCFSHTVAFILFLRSPFVSFFSFWYISVRTSYFFAAFTSVFIFYGFCSLEFFIFGLPACLFKFLFSRVHRRSRLFIGGRFSIFAG